jgi:O-antigen biosynthesis protein
MQVSLYTPSNDTRYLDAAYRSVRAQSFGDWEWIVLLNGSASNWEPPEFNSRVRVARAPMALRGIGALKRAACAMATGELLVEFDHDDLLRRDCLAEIVRVFEDPAIVFAYSDFSEIASDGSPTCQRFDPAHGWAYSEETFEGASYTRCHALAPTPHNLGYIWYAPNHVRAFRRSAYDQVGGYNEGLEFLDDQELMARLYFAGGFAQIERCLYFQRVHYSSAQRDSGVALAIQQQTQAYYCEFIEGLALAWAERGGLRCVELRIPGATGVESDERYEIVMADPADPRIDIASGTVGVLKAHDVLQRIPRRAEFFNEIYRVVAHAGLIFTQTPSTDGRGAFQDPSYTAFYNQNSFLYLTNSSLRAAIPGLAARLQMSHLRTYFPTPGHEDLNIPYVQANLLAIKDGPRQGGPLLC